MNLTIKRSMTIAVLGLNGVTTSQPFVAGRSYEVDDDTRRRLARAGALGDDSEVTTDTPDDELPGTDPLDTATKAELVDYAGKNELVVDKSLKVDDYRAAVKAAAKAKAALPPEGERQTTESPGTGNTTAS